MNFFQKRKLKSLRKKVEKAHILREQDASNINLQDEIKAHYNLAEFYKKHLFDKDLPHAEIYLLECYRAVAALGEPKAQYLCGEKLLTQAKFWGQWSYNPVYGAEIHKKYANALFEEAFSYLRTADASDYPLAKRLIGMAYIHGWGVPRDLSKGYQYILDSIDLEKAWDRATKIFEELKLSSPEFFAALQSHKRYSNSR